MSCFGKKKGEETKLQATSINDDQTIQSVKDYYSKVLTNSNDLKTSACVCASKPNSTIRSILKDVPDEILAKFYGCGNPIPLGINGLTVLDLGSGSGRDCYVCAKLVGENGKVIGVDMLDEQLNVAKKHVESFTSEVLKMKKPNMEFRTGFIEYLESSANVEKESIDLVISNCVVNLSPSKRKVIEGVYNVLKNGGEFYFSDVYADRRLSKEAQEDPILYGECISGALYINDFIGICKEIGFKDPRVLTKTEIEITNESMKQTLGNTRFYSITYRLFKLPNLEPNCEDYGQVAIYKGTIKGEPHGSILDDHHYFETNKPALVCGNTASMLEDSWLKKHFEIIGNTNVHYGEFDCSSESKPPSPSCSSNSATNNSSCC